MIQNMFSSEVELGKFLGSIEIISDAFRAIAETSLAYELHTTPSGIKVLAFKQHCSTEDTTQFLAKESDLVSLENHETVDFISTKVNSKVSINGTAIQLFERLSEDLKEVENQHIYSPLIITGWGLGGYLAVLSALRLQRAIDVEESNGAKKTKRPICITFGCPLVGDVALQKSILERPLWKSNFLNVVAKMDHVASFFTSSSPYKPFGTFMFCSEAGGHSAFEDQEAILAVLDGMAVSNIGNADMYNYGNLMSLMRRKPLYRGASNHIESNLNYLRAGITMQVKEVGMVDNIDSALVRKLEANQTKMIKNKKNADKYEPTKKLNDMKISLTNMEWYMKTRKPKGGYYDCFKDAQSRVEIEGREEIVKDQRRLNQYYKKLIEEKNFMPQKEGAKLRKRWLYSGNNYRMIVEPLDIADHYRKGNTNYIAIRPEHYVFIEKWYNEDIKNQGKGKKTKAASLTEDSCFWAHVEEAAISLKELIKDGKSSNNGTHMEKQLEDFEAYVMRGVNEFSVSPEIFLKGSSLMKWWDGYKEYKGASYASDFANYMKNSCYETYQ
uniref:senescence-associated carboxylesterase 101-like n=1 Tax=Erigeron canadensis TaxID=72917 RepID=UPI001CB8BCE1|nr:senescence-associated carboxylesterase 101-like [Erigeron canadensis]